MKKRYGNRQNMMESAFLGLMFKRLTFGEKLLFILAVALREFPMFRPCGQTPPTRRNRLTLLWSLVPRSLARGSATRQR
jgi:hypothetical protein